MFRHLLIPLDGSKLAESVLPLAMVVAERFDSEVTLLRVVRSPHIIGGGEEFPALYVTMREDLCREASEYLATKEQGWRAAGLKVNSQVREGHSIADIILECADDLDVDAIAMCTHGRSGVMRWVFGSVADKVLQQAQVPILLIRAQPTEDVSLTAPTIESFENMHSHDDPVDPPGKMAD